MCYVTVQRIVVCFRPDITVMVDWELKINYISIYLVMCYVTVQTIVVCCVIVQGRVVCCARGQRLYTKCDHSSCVVFMQWTASSEMVKEDSGQCRAVSADTNMRHYSV